MPENEIHVGPGKDAETIQEALDLAQKGEPTPEQKEAVEQEAIRRRFVRPKGVPYVREYPKNFKKTWKEFQKALSASEEFSLMWFLNLAKVLRDELNVFSSTMREQGAIPSGLDPLVSDQFVAEAALKQALVILHPYDITTNKMLLHYLKKNGIVIKG